MYLLDLKMNRMDLQLAILKEFNTVIGFIFN